MRDTRVTYIMAPDPITVDIGQTLGDARRALSSERFHHLPVLRERKLVGLISSNDLVALTAEYESSDPDTSLDRHYNIEDIMQTDLITIGHRATVEEAARLLSAGGFHALPVVDEHGYLRGVLTSTDLIEFLLEQPAEPETSIDTRERIEPLEKVLKAAERYLHSGLAESEHSRLVLAIDEARRAS